MPLISPSSTSPEITELPDDGYVFRTAPSDALQGIVLADAVGQEFGTDATISVAARNDAYGEGIANAFIENFEANGGTTTGPVLYDPEGTTFDSEAEEIVADSPDGYVIIDFEDPYGKVGAALARTGDFDPSTMFTADGLAFDPAIPDTIPLEALDGAKGTRPATPEGTDTADAFQKLYDSSSEQPKDRGTFDAQNFDAVTLCVLGAVAAGSSEGPDIQAAIQDVASAPGDKYDYTDMAGAIEALQAGEDIDFEGVSGPLDLDDNGDPTQGTYDTYSYENGKFVLGDQVEQSRASNSVERCTTALPSAGLGSDRPGPFVVRWRSSVGVGVRRPAPPPRYSSATFGSAISSLPLPSKRLAAEVEDVAAVGHRERAAGVLLDHQDRHAAAR